MGLIWSLPAAVATGAILILGLIIFDKMKSKKDSPLRKIIERFKRNPRNEFSMNDDVYYKRLSHKGGIKW